MIKFNVQQTAKFLTPSQIGKQITFGTALGLTRTAVEGQTAVMKALGDTFTLRGQWFKQSMKYGIKIKMATKTDLSSAVHTMADWLILHETGGVKTAKGGRLAIPTAEVRRTKRLIIARNQRPAALRDKRTFIIHTKNGDVLFQRRGRGKNSKIVALYNLEPRAQIKKRSTFFEPISHVVKNRLSINITEGIEKAIRTARP